MYKWSDTTQQTCSGNSVSGDICTTPTHIGTHPHSLHTYVHTYVLTYVRTYLCVLDSQHVTQWFDGTSINQVKNLQEVIGRGGRGWVVGKLRIYVRT